MREDMQRQFPQDGERGVTGKKYSRRHSPVAYFSRLGGLVHEPQVRS